MSMNGATTKVAQFFNAYAISNDMPEYIIFASINGENAPTIDLVYSYLRNFTFPIYVTNFFEFR